MAEQVTDEVHGELNTSMMTTEAQGEEEEQGEEEQGEEEQGGPRRREPKKVLARNLSQSPTLMISHSRSMHGTTPHTCTRKNIKAIC